MTSSTRFAPASEELKAYPSELLVSSAADISEPALPATADVTSTCTQTLSVVPGVKVLRTDPFGGLLLKFIDASVHVVSATAFKLMVPPEPLTTNILNVAAEMV